MSQLYKKIFQFILICYKYEGGKYNTLFLFIRQHQIADLKSIKNLSIERKENIQISRMSKPRILMHFFVVVYRVNNKYRGRKLKMLVPIFYPQLHAYFALNFEKKRKTKYSSTGSKLSFRNVIACYSAICNVCN